jgi:hypothetical protein
MYLPMVKVRDGSLGPWPPVPEGGKLGQLKIMIIGLIDQSERGEGGYLEQGTSQGGLGKNKR